LALARTIGALQIRLGPDPGPLQTRAGLAIGEKAEVIIGIDLRSGEARALDMHAGRWCAIFITTTCSACRVLAHAVARIGRDKGLGTIVLVIRSSIAQAQVLGVLPSEVITFVDSGGEMHERYEIEEVPYAFLIVDGHVRAKGVVNSRDQLDLLAEQRVRAGADPTWSPVAEEVPREEAEVGART